MMVKSWDIKPENPFFNVYLLIYVVCIMGEGCPCTLVLLWLSKDNMQESFLSIHDEGPEARIQVLSLGGKPLYLYLLQDPDVIFKWSDEWDAFLSERQKKCVSLGEYYHVTASSRLYLYSMNNLCYS